MKAFTLYQPWASLVVVGAKPFEFRRWNPRERGPAYAALVGERIVIHAASRPMYLNEVVALARALMSEHAEERAATCLRPDLAMPLLEEVIRNLNDTRTAKGHGGLPFSAGLGTAVLGEPRNGIQIAVEEFGFPAQDVDEMPGLPGFDSDRKDHANWGWPMLDVERWAAPIPMRGFQGFWNWPKPEDAGL